MAADLEEEILAHVNKSKRALFTGEIAREVYRKLRKPDIPNFAFLADKAYTTSWHVPSARDIYLDYFDVPADKVEKEIQAFRDWYAGEFFPAFLRVRGKNKIFAINLRGKRARGPSDKKGMPIRSKPAMYLAAPRDKRHLVDERIEHAEKYRKDYTAYRSRVWEYCNSRLREEFPEAEDDDIFLVGSTGRPDRLMTSFSDVDVSIFLDKEGSEKRREIRNKLNAIQREARQKFKIGVQILAIKKRNKERMVKEMKVKRAGIAP